MEAFTGAVAAGLAIHLGKKFIDKWWSSNKEQQFQAVTFGEDLAQISGHFFTPPSYFESDDEVTIIIAVEEAGGESSMFPASTSSNFTISVPEGIYSFYALVMNGAVDDFSESEIYAIGYACTADSEVIEEATFNDLVELETIVSDEFLHIEGDQSYELNFVIQENNDLIDFDVDIVSFMEHETVGADGNLTGKWHLLGRYEECTTEAHVFLLHHQKEIEGVMLLKDVNSEGEFTIWQQTVSGNLNENNFFLKGVEVRMVEGDLNEYYLDMWRGIKVDNNRIVGESLDDNGQQGHFILDRMPA